MVYFAPSKIWGLEPQTFDVMVVVIVLYGSEINKLFLLSRVSSLVTKRIHQINKDLLVTAKWTPQVLATKKLPPPL